MVAKLLQKHSCTKSLQRSRAVGDFYGTGIEIWAGFGPVWQLLWPFFSCFHGQIFFQKHCSVCTKKWHNMKLIFFFFFNLKKIIRLRNIFNFVLLHQRPLTSFLYNDFVCWWRPALNATLQQQRTRRYFKVQYLERLLRKKTKIDEPTYS